MRDIKYDEQDEKDSDMWVANEIANDPDCHEFVSASEADKIIGW